MKRDRGLTLVEIIVVLAILGILLTIGLGYFNPDRIAVSQASEVLSSQVTRARLEAIRNNTSGGIIFNTEGNGSLQVWVRDRNDPNNVNSRVVLQTITLGQGDFPRVRCQSATEVTSSTTTTNCPNARTYNFTFDARGVPQDQGRLHIVLTNFAGNFQRTVCINQQGRSQVVSGTCP
ncbi:MAG: prepilin-type N-terminal cleavage/methylation domain-containing protein [Meiothermus sp.]|uniref:pilus assembly FimT family protein n=1 Tax=Meiothermus sp. TaxID=1955249 RepID=UPI0025EB623E|nr:prepilin-type N-terminal cleavage/methylation domain-containing protein [Meiothermus sp.]MCS7069496.1 prepilin-type N-terminal cleavage/methylation domain-containing protein [Meiothermus sp.]MDW8426163.1 prepilin-type N-terminal cleavage/methylation domain-containing protein [Meiothermus sp.]